MSQHDWHSGKYPILEKTGPVDLHEDGTFWYTKDAKKGNWYIDFQDGQALLKMDWENNKGYANWKFIELSEKFIQLKCVDSKWGHFVGQKLESSNFEETMGEVVPMTLKSHPGKALVVDDDRN